nr:hypothetical protein [Pandoravirus belohorizontensis]
MAARRRRAVRSRRPVPGQAQRAASVWTRAHPRCVAAGIGWFDLVFISLLCGSEGDTGSRPSFFALVLARGVCLWQCPCLCLLARRPFFFFVKKRVQTKRAFVWPIKVAGTRARYTTGAVRAVFGSPWPSRVQCPVRALSFFPLRAPIRLLFFPIVLFSFFFPLLLSLCLPVVFVFP